MHEPWRHPDLVRHAALIASEHRRLVGHDLVPPGDALAVADALYRLPAIVLAHDAGEDPRFTYGNDAAQRVMGYPWERLVGLPSRLSAPPEGRDVRQRLLDAGRGAGVATARDLLRVTSAGRRFVIEEVTLWNLHDAQGARVGQAATYARWRWLDPA